MRKLIAVMLLSCSMFAQHQRQPDAKRTRQIQVALVNHGRHVTVNGVWNTETQDALKAIAKEHGWQHVVAPDARVLQLIGLGARYDTVLNPETAAVRCECVFKDPVQMADESAKAKELRSVVQGYETKQIAAKRHPRVLQAKASR